MPVVRPIVEDVLVLKPDLVVRSYGGGPNAEAFFASVGIPVLNIGWASTIDGEDVGAITGIIDHVANGLGQRKRGKALINEFRARLRALRGRDTELEALYMAPTGVTTGPGTLVHDILRKAALYNFQKEPGWRPLPLERLAYEQPDFIAAAFFDVKTNHKNAWSSARHPVAQRQLLDQPVVALEGAWTACGGWFIINAIEALAEGARP